MKRKPQEPAALVERARELIGELTPLKGHDCGQLCGAACCRGDERTGMLLFPGEETSLRVIEENGMRLAVCDGSCERAKRPLACMIFPLFPTVDERGRVFVEVDKRACGLCPIAAHSEEVIFDRAFCRAVEKAGKLLATNEECLEFMQSVTEQIDDTAMLCDSLLGGEENE